MLIIQKNGKAPRDLVFRKNCAALPNLGEMVLRKKREKKTQMWGMGYILLTENKEACDHVALTVQSEL